MNFCVGTDKDRKELGVLRAASWRGKLTVDQFCRRNDRLYRHSYGQKIRTFCLKSSEDGIEASLDSLPIKFFLKRSKGQVETRDGFLLASVIVPENKRGQGFGRRLVKDYFAFHPGAEGVLYSDIDPIFYEQYGFKLQQMGARTLFASAQPAQSRTRVSLEEFSSWLKARREALVANAAEGTVAIVPEFEWMDWQIERFRFFCEEAGRPFLEKELVWHFVHENEDHLLLVAPHHIKEELHALWVPSGCQLCENELGGILNAYGLPKGVFWGESRGADSLERPMFKLNTPQPARPFADIQWCDWW